MSDFRAKVFAELITSGIEKDFKKIENKKISLNNITFDSAGLAKRIQTALNDYDFTLNLTNVTIGNISSKIAGNMQSAGEQAGQEFSKSLLDKINSRISSGGIDASVAAVTQKFRQLRDAVNNMGSGEATDKLRSQLDSLSKEFETLNSAQKTFSKEGLSDSELVSTYEQFNNTLSRIRNTLTIAQTETKQFASATEVVTLQNKMQVWLQNNTRAAKVYGEEIKNLINLLNSLVARGDITPSEIKEISTEYMRIDQSAYSAGLKGKTLMSMMGGAFKSISRYVGASRIIYSGIKAIKTGVQSVIDLDTALVDLQKTTNATSHQLRDFYYSANDTAKQLGVTTKEVIQAAAEWSRLGYSIKDAKTMSEVSSIFASISPGMDIQTATDGLISTMKANKHKCLVV